MNTVIDHRTNKHDIRPFRVRKNALLNITAFILPQLLITTLLSGIFKSMNGTQSQTNSGQCVWKNLNDDRDHRKIEVQKYLENEMKNKLSVRGNLS